MFGFIKNKANLPPQENTDGQANSQLKGAQVEQKVKAFLLQQNYCFVDENFHSRFGEIDLIFEEPALQKRRPYSSKTLVFIEVRYRANNAHGSGAETVSQQKQSKIIKTAQAFLQKEPQYAHFNCRFDVISVSRSGEQKHQSIDQANKQQIEFIKSGHTYQWFKDAFQANPW